MDIPPPFYVAVRADDDGDAHKELKNTSPCLCFEIET